MKYFYHGFEFYSDSVLYSIKKMIKILDEGLTTRNIIRNIDDYSLNHICLYRKNDEYDYEKKDALLKSARGGWIDHSFVIIIDPNISARKVEEETDLVDEWRTYGNIDPSHFVGIALPYDNIKDYLNDCDKKEEIEQYLKLLHDKALKMNIMIENSDKDNFTDLLDSLYSQKNKVV